MGLYTETISTLAPAGYDPAEIEAFMRIEHGTLNHLSRERMAEEILVCCMTIDQAGPSLSRALARSYGLETSTPGIRHEDHSGQPRIEEIVGPDALPEYCVSIITTPRGNTPWYWRGLASSAEEAEFCARDAFERETGITDYTVAAICTEEEMEEIEIGEPQEA